jgi:hypothetical protein
MARRETSKYSWKESENKKRRRKEGEEKRYMERGEEEPIDTKSRMRNREED